MLDSTAGSGTGQAQAHGRVAFRKRAFDILVGGFLCLIAIPVIAVLAVGVVLSLRANPFFVQRRPGLQGRELTIVKLRTLPTSTPSYADKHSLGLDTMKLPWLCSLLRRSHLDELPQLFSVVLGHMSLVGPRPALPGHVEPVAEQYESLRRSVRPGCTGLWQLSVASSDTATSAPNFDLFYVRHASTRFDLWIVARTVGWILGLVPPIETSDVPLWVLGPGLLDRSLLIFDHGTPEPVEELPAGWRRPAAAAAPAQSAPAHTEAFRPVLEVPPAREEFADSELWPADRDVLIAAEAAD
ncbi:MAG TPA: sugar transferase [Mycobacteriales bacterium]|nr:sugar transferase [Mycobacteriales bacterium]